MHRGHVSEKSLAKQIGDRQRKDKRPLSRRSPMTGALAQPRGKWTPHGLRRSGATIMGNLGVRPGAIEKCLNHIEQNGIKQVYQRQTLRPEMRDAWKPLGEHLQQLTASSPNVSYGTSA
jgi:integrase